MINSMYAWCYRCRRKVIPYVQEGRKYGCPLCNNEVKKLFRIREGQKILNDINRKIKYNN